MKIISDELWNLVKRQREKNEKRTCEIYQMRQKFDERYEKIVDDYSRNR